MDSDGGSRIGACVGAGPDNGWGGLSGLSPLAVSTSGHAQLAGHLVRMIPRVRGNWLLARIVFHCLPRRYRRLSLTASWRRRTAEVRFDIAQPPQFSMVRDHRFDLMTAAVILDALEDGGVFVDVGANWGYFTVLAAQLIGEGGLVLALEPDPTAYGSLLRTLRSHRLPNVIPLPYAAWDRAGETVSLRRPWYRQTTSTYIRPTGPPGYLSALTSTLDTLDELLLRDGPRVRLVKIDTEGAELIVLKGGTKLLARFKPSVLVEVSGYAARFGYRIEAIYDLLHDLGYASAYQVEDAPGREALRGPLDRSCMMTGNILFRPYEMAKNSERRSLGQYPGPL